LHQWLIRTAAGLAITAILAACGASDTPERRATALNAVQRYFEVLASNDSDRGWSFLDRTMHWTDFDAYERAVESAELGDFEVTATETLRCDEGYACRVCLKLARPGVTPEFLGSADGRSFDGIIVFDDPLPCGNAMIGVGLDPLTGSLDGVWIGQ